MEYHCKEEKKDHFKKPISSIEMHRGFLALLKETMRKPDSSNEVNKVFENMLAYKIEAEMNERVELKHSLNKAIDSIIPGSTKKILADCLETKGFFEMVHQFRNATQKEDLEEYIRSLNFTDEQKLKSIQYGEFVTEEAQRLKL